ncbi:MAG: hypothetical protein A2Y10_13955 [Planctomycetes bacterium GWF2_41_51]|nr:MAG: hypothetical protein A2Y10_13955 [Planctomycetes bacterium GWF2_41_51]
MIKRKIKDILKSRLQAFPAVALVGSRQTGKTTLAKSLGGIYFDLEQDGDRLSLDLQWETLIKQDKIIILDEAQESPEVFKKLRGAIDNDRKRNGRFLLLGSVSPYLMKFVSESLAGRMAILELTPFLWSEIPKDRSDNLWFYGGYPDGGILDSKNYPDWQNNYLNLLISRDLPDWGLPAQPQMTNRLMKMLAALNGQNFNASLVGKSLDLSYKTVNSYLDYLEGAFLIRRLQPFYSNLKKRIVKSPKIYWRDSGLLHSINNITSENELLNQPWVGTSWEGFIIEQVINNLKAADKKFEAYFLRTSDQYEIDLVLDFGKEIWTIEVKLTASPNTDDIKKLNKVSDLIAAKKQILISRTNDCIDNGKTVSCNLEWFINNLIQD